jgi:hypothetical protein
MNDCSPVVVVLGEWGGGNVDSRQTKEFHQPACVAGGVQEVIRPTGGCYQCCVLSPGAWMYELSGVEKEG